MTRKQWGHGFYSGLAAASNVATFARLISLPSCADFNLAVRQIKEFQIPGKNLPEGIDVYQLQSLEPNGFFHYLELLRISGPARGSLAFLLFKAAQLSPTRVFLGRRDEGPWATGTAFYGVGKSLFIDSACVSIDPVEMLIGRCMFWASRLIESTTMFDEERGVK